MSLRFLSFSTLGAGLLTVIISYSSSIAIVLQAAHAAGADSAQLHSWMWALGIGVGVSTLLPSLLSKTPVVMAWSTPGAAMPKPFIAAIAGLALIGTISQSFGQAFSEPAHRESALFAFLATASGISLFNIGSAFWGLLCGLIVHHLFRSANTPT